MRNVGSLSITDVYFGRDVRIRRLLRESEMYRTQGGKLSMPGESLGAILIGNMRRMNFLMPADLFYRPENGVIFPPRPETLSIAPRVRVLSDVQ